MVRDFAQSGVYGVSERMLAQRIHHGQRKGFTGRRFHHRTKIRLWSVCECWNERQVTMKSVRGVVRDER